VRYEVYAWDLSVRAAHLDQSHAFFNGTSVFLCAEGKERAARRGYPACAGCGLQNLARGDFTAGTESKTLRLRYVYRSRLR
jgi:hypothetical protein